VALRRGIPIAALLLAVAGGGCLHRRAAGVPPADDGTVHVVVTNNYEVPMVVYASGTGTTLRLGIVAPGIEREFVLRRHSYENGPVTFSAGPSGDPRRVSAWPLQLVSGDVVDFVIATLLNGTTATIRP